MDQFLSEAPRMRVAAVKRSIHNVEPSDPVELAGIKRHGLITAYTNNLPERHVRMLSSHADCRRASDHYVGFDGVSWYNAEFFLKLSFNRLPWVFSRFYMATGWQPKLCILVIHQ